MDWSFLANETQLTAKHYGPTGMFDPNLTGHCEISNSQGQVFLTVREQVSICATWAELCKGFWCCCLKYSNPETVKRTGSHPSFGDVITSQQIKNEVWALNCSGHHIEGYYSGEQFLGAFQSLTPPGCCTTSQYALLDANSDHLMSATKGASTQNEAIVFSQGEEVACTIQSNADYKGGFLTSEYTGATGNAVFAAHLPIPIKLCLLMTTAKSAKETYRRAAMSQNRH